MGHNNFFTEDLRFQCQGSGNCCVSRGDYGYVYLTQDDVTRLAKRLKLSPSQLLVRFCEATDGFVHLKESKEAYFEAQGFLRSKGLIQTTPKSYGQECLFLDQRRCSVYEARPTQCRTWPFWPENMNAKSWKALSKSCPGIGKGEVRKASDIEGQLKDQRQSEAKILRDH